MPIGIIADKLNRNRIFAALGCVLIILSPTFDSAPIFMSIFAGLGNAFFHIGAGRDVLCGAKQKFSALGVFVSPGAAGLYFGMKLGKASSLPIFSVLGTLLVIALAIYIAIPFLYEKQRMESKPFKISVSSNDKAIIALICLLLVVCLRSYVGMSLSFPWKGEGYFALVLTLSVVLGKASGGFVADKFVAVKASLVSLSFCAILFFFYKTPICGILAVLLFNMTMPITLGAVAKLFPSALGFGFGLLTFALFLGFIPIILGSPNFLILPIGFSAACIVSAILLYFGLKEPDYAA